ncbi:MAG: NAD(P)/FAD-dependent oxidoreductase [Myxococcota bacterium]|jgi:2,4-dienoyl-CoA reductase (NADPH2)|nr:NAD(P)/FAD-dependent oxidoreductase [Myxococcota bacterium]
MTHDSQKLFEPVSILRRKVRNRIAMPAMHLGLAKDGAPTQELTAFYERRAQGGVAMITIGVCNTWIGPGSAGLRGDLDLATDASALPFEQLTRRVKAAGASIGAQLCPLQGYNNPAWWPTEHDIEPIVRSFGQAASRAQRCGFDFVELMLSGGSLLSHFASTAFNRGALAAYGGDFEGRVRLAREAISAIREATSAALPIAARIHSHELLPGGYDTSGAVALAKALCAAGVEAISLTGAGHRTQVPQLLPETPPLAFAYLARPIALSIDRPVLCGGRIRTVDEAQKALAVSKAAMVNLARPLLVDPDWPLKAHSGQGADITPCMACGVCLDKVFAKQPARCPLSPDLGREGTAPLPRGIDPLPSRSRVLVVGAGPAGLRASLTLAESGHEVELADRAPALGGRWNVAAAVHGRADLRLGLSATIRAMEQAGVRTQLGQQVFPDAVRRTGVDAVLLATGSQPRLPVIPGLERHPRVLLAEQAIWDPSLADGDVVVLGGGGVGVEVALHLATEHELPSDILGYIARKSGAEHIEALRHLGSGRRITLVRRRGYVGKGLGRSLRWALLADLERLGVHIVDKCAYEEITEHGVILSFGSDKERRLLEASTLVIATGQCAPPDLLETWKDSAPRVLAVGDATGTIGNLADAMLGAHELCLALCAGRSNQGEKRTHV